MRGCTHTRPGLKIFRVSPLDSATEPLAIAPPTPAPPALALPHAFPTRIAYSSGAERKRSTSVAPTSAAWLPQALRM